jgi:hypothetical protein
LKKLKLQQLIKTVFVSLSVCSIVIGLTACGNNVEVKNPFEAQKNIQLEVIRVKGEDQSEIFTSTLVDIVVVSNENNAYTIQWKYGKTQLKGNNAQVLTPEQDAILNVYQNFVMDLTFTPQGEVKIHNFEKVYTEVEDMFFTLYKIDKQDVESEMYQNLKMVFKEGAATQLSFLTNYFPEIPQFLNLLGKKYASGEFAKTDSISSPSGKGYLYLSSFIEIEDVDGLKEVYVEEKINPDDVKKMYIEYLKETQGADQHIDEDKIPPFNYQKTTIIQVDENEQIIKSEIKLKLDNGMDKMESSTILKILK